LFIEFCFAAAGYSRKWQEKQANGSRDAGNANFLRIYCGDNRTGVVCGLDVGIDAWAHVTGARRP